MEGLDKLQRFIDESDNIVFFGGAGVSTESGIPDFRSVDGLYNQKYEFPPEYMLSHSCYRDRPEAFFRFYHDKILVKHNGPNPAHKKLAQLEKTGKLRAVITQNIDGLHTAAGSKTVIELHGSIHRNYCDRCGKTYPLEFMEQATGVPRCTCGGTVRPDVVLYEEALDTGAMERAAAYIASADLLIIGGTSLVVWPAAGLVDYFRGRHLVVINKGPTGHSGKAELVIDGPIGKILGGIRCR